MLYVICSAAFLVLAAILITLQVRRSILKLSEVRLADFFTSLSERDTDFLHAFLAMQQHVHSNSRDKGWWESPPEVGTQLALIHSEVSEILEAIRIGNPPSAKVPEFTSAEEELADVVLRCMDLAEGRGWRLAAAILAKHNFNQGRPSRHGGKAF